MSEVVNNTNIADTSNNNDTDTLNNNSTDTNNDNEFILSKEQQRVVDLCAREQVLALREKAIAKREIEAYATESLMELGFNEEQKELAFKLINFNDNNTCKASIEIISQICEARALDIVNLRLRSSYIPKAYIQGNKSRTQLSTFEKEVQNLKSR